MGKDAASGVRGLIVDPEQRLRSDSTEIKALVRPSLVGHQAGLDRLLSSDASIGLVRADPGFGGTRMLVEIESASLPARCLYLSGAGAEPLGALRRSFARSIAMSGPEPLGSLPPVHRRGLERLLAGEGVDVRFGAELVARWVTLPAAAGDEVAPGAILIDDAMEVDDPSLDAVAIAAEQHAPEVRIVARLDSRGTLPPPFQRLEVGTIVNLGPLPRACAEQLASSATLGTLSSEVARRWARRGRFVPLGIVEALSEGIATGELAGRRASSNGHARAADLGLQLEPSEWVARRLKLLPSATKAMLRAVAMLGVEVTAPLAHELAVLREIADPAREVGELCRGGWLGNEPEGFYVLPSRTHRDVIVGDIPEEERRVWHEAASIVVERLGGKLASAEAARHAVLSGNQARAVELALVAAKSSRQLELEAATEALLAFAGASQDDIAPGPEPAADFRLLSWIDALRRTGDRDGVAARLSAIASLARGETSEALVSLREGVELAEGEGPSVRSRAALAYGIALAVVGRRAESLLVALDALARAREGKEALGARACARFLARLSMAAGHGQASKEWQSVAVEEA